MKEEKFQKLLNVRSPVVLTSRNQKWLCFLVSITFLTLILAKEVLVSPPSSINEWIVIILFSGLFLLITLCSLWVILFPKSFSLTLNQQGFTVKQLYRVSHYLWKEVSDFDMRSTPRYGFFKVYFDDGHQSSQDKLMRVFSRNTGTLKFSVGKNHFLPDTYGMKASQLAALMNHWRERALQNG